MAYAWIEKKHLVRRGDSSKSTTTTSPITICDTCFHCRKECIVNQYLTVLAPSEHWDRLALSSCKEVRFSKDKELVDLRKLEGQRLMSSSMEFPIDEKDIKSGWASLNVADTNRIYLCWDDPWPADYDDPRSPPVGISLEAMWLAEDARRQALGHEKPLSLYQRQSNCGFDRAVQCPSEMIEEGAQKYIEKLCLKTPSRHFGAESFLVQYLNYLCRSDIPLRQEPPTGFFTAKPLWTNASDIAFGKLDSYIKKFHRVVRQLSDENELKPVLGSNLKGFVSLRVLKLLSINSKNRLVFFHKAPPSLNSLEIAGHLTRPKKKVKITDSDHSEMILDLSLDVRGRAIVSTIKPPGDNGKISLTPIEFTSTTISQPVVHPDEVIPLGQDSWANTLEDECEGSGRFSDMNIPQIASSTSKGVPLDLQKEESLHSNVRELIDECEITEVKRNASDEATTTPKKERNFRTMFQPESGRRRGDFLHLLASVNKFKTSESNKKGAESLLSLTPKTSKSPSSDSVIFDSPKPRKSPGLRTMVDSPVVSPPLSKVPETALHLVSDMSPQIGLHLGRILGFEVLTSLLFRGDGKSSQDYRPKTFRQAKRMAPEPNTCHCLAVVYLCRVDVCTDLPYSHQARMISRVIPGQEVFSAQNFRGDESYIDFHGAVFVDNEMSPTSTWTVQQVNVTKEKFRENKLTNAAYLLGKEGVDVGINTNVFQVPTELDLIYWVIHYLFRIFDPSCVMGFDTYTSSIGYFIRRAEALGLTRISRHLSRLPPSTPLIPENQFEPKIRSGKTNQVLRSSGEVSLAGRIVINVWRQVRAEIKSPQYSVQGLCGPLLGITFPHYPKYTLAQWWGAVSPSNSEENSARLRHPLRFRVLNYLVKYVSLTIEIVTALNVLTRGAEVARFLGTDIWAVLSRGQQHRVECLLSRAAHAVGYLLLTAAKSQVQKQPAVMALPLVLEPESAFYWWPVVVLDFQSLYPSIIVAYNFCYSTCLGKLRTMCEESALSVHISDSLTIKKPLGVFNVSASKACLFNLEDEACKRTLTADSQSTSPGFIVGADETVYVSRHIRRGVIPALIEEVISTRIMTKESIHLVPKGYPGSARLIRLFNHQQFGLKMFANCTYGYATATYTGRMPCSELADSIVQTARRTLERSIAYVEEHPSWKARVVYGDTDSLFVYLEGRSVKDAFRIGKEIVNEISAINPWPLTLNLEKVYAPCCLQTKKRYVGWSYSNEFAEPKLDSKGIETVRRDQCPAVSNALKDSLKTIFATRDFSKLLMGEPYVPLFEYIFLRELKLGAYAFDRGAAAHTLPPQAVVSYAMVAEWEDQDEEQPSRKTAIESHFDFKAPLAYVVARGPPGSRLIDLVVPPDRVTEASQPLCPLSPVCPQMDRMYHLWALQRPLILDSEWYILKQVLPVLQRILGLLGIGPDLTIWYSALTKPALGVLKRRQLSVSTTATAVKICRPSGPIDHPWFVSGVQVTETHADTSILTANQQNAVSAALGIEEHEIIDIVDIEQEGSLTALDEITEATISKVIIKEETTHDTQTIKEKASTEGMFSNNSIYEVQEHSAAEEGLSAQDVTKIQQEDLSELQESAPADSIPWLSASKSGKSSLRKSPPIAPPANSLTLLPFLPVALSGCRVCRRTCSASYKKKNDKTFSVIKKRATHGKLGDGNPRGTIFKRGDTKIRMLERFKKHSKGNSSEKIVRPHTKPNITDSKVNLKPKVVSEENLSIDISDDDLQSEIDIQGSAETGIQGAYAICLSGEQLLSNLVPGVVSHICRAEDSAHEQTSMRLCNDCQTHTRETIYKLPQFEYSMPPEKQLSLQLEIRRNHSERRFALLTRLCVNCSGNIFAAEACHDAFLCPVYTRRLHARRALDDVVQDIEDLRHCIPS